MQDQMIPASDLSDGLFVSTLPKRRARRAASDEPEPDGSVFLDGRIIGKIDYWADDNAFEWRSTDGQHRGTAHRQADAVHALTDAVRSAS